jgi:nitroreductase
MQAIHKRRSVRHFKSQPIESAVINRLLNAAVQAPTSLHTEPWAFAIIRDRDLLEQISSKAKESADRETRACLPDLLRQPDFNIFYNAGTLVVIYGRPQGSFVAADCWLAAENLMLAACAMGLGTCVIGLALQVLNMPEWKSRLGIPPEMTAYVPLVVGVPDGDPPPVSRKPPEILAW